MLAGILAAGALSGCGGISNDIISISSYKELEVVRPVDEEDAEAVSKFENDVWQALYDNCTIKEYPEEELEAMKDELETQYGYAAYYKDMSASELIEEIHGITTEELAMKMLMKKYAVALIAEKEDLNLTAEEYEEALAELAGEKGFEDVKEYENMFGYEELKEMFLEERVLEFLIAHVK